MARSAPHSAGSSVARSASASASAGSRYKHHGRHERAGEEIGGQHGEDDRQGQRREQVGGRTGQEHDRHEDDADAQRGDEGRRGDLGRPVQDRPPQRLLHGDVAVDVLHLDGRVVHEDAHGQGHAAQRHGVERVAHRPQDDHRGQDRQRDRGGDDQRAPPRAQEQEDHQGRQPRGDRPFLEHALDGRLDEDRLVEEELQLDLGRNLGLDAGHGLAHAADDTEGRGPFRFEDGHQDRPPAVAADDVHLHGVAVAHVRHVLDVDRNAVDRLDGDVVEGRRPRRGCC